MSNYRKIILPSLVFKIFALFKLKLHLMPIFCLFPYLAHLKFNLKNKKPNIYVQKFVCCSYYFQRNMLTLNLFVDHAKYFE